MKPHRLLVAATLLAAALPATAYGQPLPGYATADEQIRGRIAAVTGKYHLSLRDERGYVDSVTLHNGTTIEPTGLTLAPGQSVTIFGHAEGATFVANEIVTPYAYGASRAYPPEVAYPYTGGYAYGSPYPYGPPYPYPYQYPYPYYGGPSFGIVIGGGNYGDGYYRHGYYGHGYYGHGYYGHGYYGHGNDGHGDYGRGAYGSGYGHGSYGYGSSGRVSGGGYGARRYPSGAGHASPR